MKISHTKNSRRDFQKLPSEIQKIAEKQLKLFANNPFHPSLEVKKVQGLKGIWEGRITKRIRFTFHISGDVYLVRRIGKHNEVLKRP